MLNIFSILGPSRSGKGTVLSLISSAKNFELPYATPDLDWYVDLYHSGEISKEALSKLCVNYMFCYSWYGHLGRHINLRPNDYSSPQSLMPHLDLNLKYNKQDNDDEFIKFLSKNDSRTSWNTFSWEIPPEIFEIINEKYPINLNPLFCYRNPYALFSSWISGNRINRSASLSRMFKFPSVENLHRSDLVNQFSGTRNKDEMIINNNKFIYNELKLDHISVETDEESKLLMFIKQNNEHARYWSKKKLMYNFENIVSKPNSFIDYLTSRFDIEFDSQLLKKSIIHMNKRPLNEVLETDFDKVNKTLKNLGCKEKTIDFIVNEQKIYIENL